MSKDAGGGVLVLFFPVCDRPNDYFSKAEAVSAKPGKSKSCLPTGSFLLTCARRSKREIKGKWVTLDSRGVM